MKVYVIILADGTEWYRGTDWTELCDQFDEAPDGAYYTTVDGD